MARSKPSDLERNPRLSDAEQKRLDAQTKRRAQVKAALEKARKEHARELQRLRDARIAADKARELAKTKEGHEAGVIRELAKKHVKEAEDALARATHERHLANVTLAIVKNPDDWDDDRIKRATRRSIQAMVDDDAINDRDEHVLKATLLNTRVDLRNESQQAAPLRARKESNEAAVQANKTGQQAPPLLRPASRGSKANDLRQDNAEYLERLEQLRKRNEYVSEAGMEAGADVTANDGTYINAAFEHGTWVITDPQGRVGRRSKKTGVYTPYTIKDFDDSYEDEAGWTIDGTGSIRATNEGFTFPAGDKWGDTPEQLKAMGAPDSYITSGYERGGETGVLKGVAQAGTWETAMQFMQRIKNLPTLEQHQFMLNLFNGGFFADEGPAPVAGIFASRENAALSSFAALAAQEGPDDSTTGRIGRTVDELLMTEVSSTNALKAFELANDGGGGGGGGGATSYSATDPAALHIQAQQVAQAVLGRMPTDEESRRVVQVVQQMEAAEGNKESGPIINVDPAAVMTNEFRSSRPDEFQAKNIADAFDMFASILSAGGIAGRGGASQVRQGLS